MRLRPWAKVTLIFIIGVVAVSQIFRITGSRASSGERVVFHGIIEMNLGGKSHIKNLDGAWEKEVRLKTKEDYRPMQIVTVVMEDDEVVNDYITEGKELDKVLLKSKKSIEEYRESIRTTTNLRYR